MVAHRLGVLWKFEIGEIDECIGAGRVGSAESVEGES